MSAPAYAGPDAPTQAELQRLREQVTALEQLLEVHEQTALDQATRLEALLRARSEALAHERAISDKLVTSEQRLRLALDAGQMGAWEWDIVGNRVYWSPEEERLYGLAPGQYAGTVEDYVSRIHPEDRESSFALVQDALARRAPSHHVTHRILRADGQVRWLESHALFEYGPDGSPLRLVGVSTDITDARAQQQLLEAREEQFRTLANSIPQLAWMTDQAGAIEWYNQRWYEYTGTSAGAMLGWDWKAVHHPDHVERVVAHFRAAIAQGEAWEDTFPLRGADGEYRWFLSRALPIRNRDGSIARWFGTNTDITDRLEIEEARDRALAEARAGRERLYEVFQQAPAAIAVVEGPDHVFTVTNPPYLQMAGNRPRIGQSVRSTFPELASQGLFDLLDQVYRTGEAHAAHELPIRFDRDGDGIAEELFVNFVYQPLLNADGSTFGIMIHAVDVTEQVRARHIVEERAAELARLTRDLERSNQELDQFAYVASHDLKAPLRGIANLSQWIREDLGDRLTGDSQRHIELLHGRVQRMESLIDGILAYSRAGRVEEKTEVVDVRALIEETIALVAAPPAARITIEGEMPVLRTQRVPLQQVFLNLIANAIKYNDKAEPRVTVSVREDGPMLRFTVTDNGPGIAPQFHDRIWQIFQTLAPRDSIEGTGIGLSVVRKLVEARGGRVSIDSGVGRGATFHFTWPSGPRTTS